MVILSHLVTAIITYTNSHKPDFPQGGGHQLEIMSSTGGKTLVHETNYIHAAIAQCFGK